MKIRDLLLCECNKIEFDFVHHEVKMFLPPQNYTDMDGAIKVAKMLDLGVTKISTFVGNELDTVYVQELGSTWQVG